LKLPALQPKIPYKSFLLSKALDRVLLLFHFDFSLVFPSYFLYFPPVFVAALVLKSSRKKWWVDGLA